MTTRLRHAAAPDGTSLCNRGHVGKLADPPNCPACALIKRGHLLAADVVKQAGISPRQLDHWVRLGLARPDQALPGSGQRRTYPPSEVAAIKAMGALTSAGLSLPEAHALARTSPEDAHRVAATITHAMTDLGIWRSAR